MNNLKYNDSKLGLQHFPKEYECTIISFIIPQTTTPTEILECVQPLQYILVK